VPKLGIFSGEEIIRIMESEGFVRARQKGSHLMMQRRTDRGTTTVPVPPHQNVKIGTLQSIIRQSGISRERFLVWNSFRAQHGNSKGQTDCAMPVSARSFGLNLLRQCFQMHRHIEIKCERFASTSFHFKTVELPSQFLLLHLPSYLVNQGVLFVERDDLKGRPLGKAISARGN